MPSKLSRTTSGRLQNGESFKIYSMIVQAQWLSSSVQLLFDGVNITIEALWYDACIFQNMLLIMNKKNKNLFINTICA